MSRDSNHYAAEDLISGAKYFKGSKARRLFLDAGNRGLVDFNLKAHIDDTSWNKLTHLYLPQNLLLRLPDELFTQTPNLAWLDVRWNELCQFPVTVRHSYRLQVVLLQGNNLLRLPIEFGALKSLRCLHIINNPLEFPSKKLRRQFRTNGDLIQFLRCCWNQQSVDVGPTTMRRKPRPFRKKLPPIRKLKDHTEVIVQLKNSGKVNDQIMAEEMLQVLQLEQNLVQAFKSRDVLKKWRNKYQTQRSDGTSRSSHRPRTLFSGGGDSCSDSNKVRLYPSRDVDSAILDLQKRLASVCSVSRTSGSDQEIRQKDREIKDIENLQREITHLKERC